MADAPRFANLINGVLKPPASGQYFDSHNPATGEFSLVDLDSSNGTYVAIHGDVTLQNGDFVRIGQHLFRVDLA